MRKLNVEEISRLEEHNTGTLHEIRVTDDFDLSKCEIIGNNFRGKNTFGSNLFLMNSILSDSTIDSDVSILTSTVVKSVVGQCTVIKNNSVVKDTVISPLVVPVLQKNKKTDRLFYVLINNSQVEGDVILGGTDMRKTKSRGGSVYAFAHIGEGEFTKNIIFGSQPDAESKKKLVCIPHFGYYGKMIVTSLAVYDDGVLDIDSDSFFNAYTESFSNRFFNTKLPGKVTYETGRINIGSGGSMSDYDSVKDTKAGAIILLADIGVNVTIPPFLTMLYHSLIANGSDDIIKITKNNIIPPGSLANGARNTGFMLEGYYTDNEPKIMNDRCHAEMEFVVRYLKLILTFAKISERGCKNTNGIQKYAWNKAVETLITTAKSVNGRWLKAYFETLEKCSIPGLEKRLEKNYQPRLQKKLDIQLGLLAKKSHLLKTGDSIFDEIKKLHAKDLPIIDIYEKTGKKVRIEHTTEHDHQLKTSIIRVPDEVEA